MNYSFENLGYKREERDWAVIGVMKAVVGTFAWARDSLKM